MAAESYMNSTTKYMKVNGKASVGPTKYSPPAKDSPVKEKSIPQKRPHVRPETAKSPIKIESQEKGPSRLINRIG